MTHLFQYIGKAFITSALAIAGVFGLNPTPSVAPVGAVIPVALAVFQSSLQASISTSATSMTLVSGTDKAGNALSGYICFNIDEGTAIEEFVCGTASGTAITGMVRGLDPVDGDLEVTALKKAHKRGASVKVTNYPSLGILSRILNGNETLPNPITYASGIGPVGVSDLADKEYVLSVVSGGTVSFNQVIVSGTAGETISAGNLIYFDTTQNEWMKTDADTATTIFNVKLGIAQGSGTDGVAISGGVLTSGEYTTSGLTKGDIEYASNTAGAISSTVGTVPRVIGVAKDSTTLLFAPEFQGALQNYNVDSVGTDSYAITLGEAFGAYYAGMQVSFKAGTANTGAATLAINGGTAKAIVKNASTALETGDIIANQIVQLVYDGTNFQIISRLATPSIPTMQTFTTSSTSKGSSTTRFDITNTAGSTYRYTWDGTGTDPNITSVTVPTGIPVLIESNLFSAGNNGFFLVTGSSTNYFEVTNASGVAENDKTLSSFGFLKTITAQTYTTPAGVKYVTLEVQGAGGGGGGAAGNGDLAGNGGGGGAFSRKTVSASTLGSSQTLYVGPGGVMAAAGGPSGTMKLFGSSSIFGSIVTAPGGQITTGGTASGGDVNITGANGGAPVVRDTAHIASGGYGGASRLGGGGQNVVADGAGVAGSGYGGGGSGAFADGNSSDALGGAGAPGIIIVTEFY